MRIWHQSFSDLDRAPVYRATLARHAEAVMPAGDRVVLHGLRPGTYGNDFAPIHAIRRRYLECLNEAQVVEAALAAEREGYDAFALGCFYDPALRAARSLMDIPCFGLSETCMLVACSLGQRFGLVSLEASQRAQHEELARAYGLRERLAGWWRCNRRSTNTAWRVARRPPGHCSTPSMRPAASSWRWAPRW
jgi:hypothetical protein